jgi:hypothetical protein
MFYVMLSKTSLICVALFIPAFQCFAFVFVCYRHNLSVFLNVFNISLTCVLCFFLKHTGELHIIILRRNEVESVQPPPRYKLKLQVTSAAIGNKKEDDLSIKTATLLGAGP